MRASQPKTKAGDRTRTIFYVGGGSGGHITPLLAIHQQILKLKPELNFFLITDKKSLPITNELFKDNREVKFKSIYAGKFRRHPNLSLVKKLWLAGYFFKNITDVIKVAVGFCQSLLLVVKLKPQVVVSKGGYVAIPVVYAAKLFKSKIIIHDSDTRPGLASKLTSPLADKIFTGFNTEIYPKSKTEWVGVPINESRSVERDKIKLNQKFKTILILGGGNGSGNLNEIIELNLPNLLKKYNIVHQTGKGKELDFDSSKYPADYIQFGFCSQDEMFQYLKFSDLVISRAGATSIQELAYNKKPSIIIPSPYLSDQIKNIDFLEERGAALGLNELELAKKPSLLLSSIKKAIENSDQLSINIFKIYKSGAAKKMAQAAISLL
jgi:UDP-N-acetylglucosamine--N-acetylmuramyl-(pentapeptide) pyrophosphoryl-undecaprenol N-acetylglucosamine transferase